MNEKPNVTTNRINYRSACHDIEKHPAAASLSRHPRSPRTNTLLIIAILSAMAISMATLAVLFHIQRIELVQIRRDIGIIANKIDKYQESREDVSTSKRKFQPMIATSSKPIPDVATPTSSLASTPESSQTPNATSTPTESLNTKLNSSIKETVEKSIGSSGFTTSTIQKQESTPTPYEYFKIRTKDKILVYVTRIDSKVDNLDNKIKKLHSYVKKNVRKLIRLHETPNGKPTNDKDNDKDKDKKDDKISGSDFLDLLNKNSKLKDKD